MANQKNQSVADRIRGEAKARLKEVTEQLGPLQDEKSDLEDLLNVGSQAVAPQPKPEAVKPRQTRSRKGGRRADQAVSLIVAKPGITASEIASALKIKPNYLYRVLKDEVQAGRIKKDRRSYLPA